MATLALYELFSQYVTVDGSNNATLVADQSVNGYNLTEGTSTNGGVWSASSFGGYPSILMDGVDDYLINNGGLANAMVGGNDVPFAFDMAFQHISDGTSGDVVIGCGTNATINPFFRLAEGTTGSWTSTKRDAATGSGGGSGVTNAGSMGTTQIIVEVEHTGTAISIFTWRYPQTITTVANAVSSDVGTLGTLVSFAIGTLFRTSAGGCSNFRWAYLHVMNAIPTATERKALRSLEARYTSAPYQYNVATRRRRDRLIHDQLRPTTWKTNRNGLMLPAEDTRIIQVNGFKQVA